MCLAQRVLTNIPFDVVISTCTVLCNAKTSCHGQGCERARDKMFSFRVYSSSPTIQSGHDMRIRLSESQRNSDVCDNFFDDFDAGGGLFDLIVEAAVHPWSNRVHETCCRTNLANQPNGY